MAPSPSQRLYEMGRKHRESEEQPVTIPDSLVQPKSQKPSRPLKRYLSGIEEVFALYDQVRSANASWMADTIENKRRVCELFTSDDPRISERLDLNDMVTAATILSAYLDRVPPPPKPKFEDSIESWQLPMPSPEWALRKATKEQLNDYIPRAKAYEQWLKENQQ